MSFAKIAFLLAGLCLVASVVFMVQTFWQGILGRGGNYNASAEADQLLKVIGCAG